MYQHGFDETSLVRQLSRLPADSALVFSLCCATRQLAAGEQFVERFSPESRGVVRAIIEQIWSAVTSDASTAADWGAALEDVMELLPEEQDHWAPIHVYADHAISSLAYTIRCLLKSDVREAAWSARRAYEAADQAAIRDLDVHTGTAGVEARILAHSIVQRELKRQERDLQLLQSIPTKQTFNALKTRAFNEPMLSFEEMSK